MKNGRARIGSNLIPIKQASRITASVPNPVNPEHPVNLVYSPPLLPVSPVFPVVLFLLLWLVVCCPSVARARVVVVVCERLTWEDVVSECPFLLGWIQQNRCAVGLMNTAVAGQKNPTSAMLAIAQGQLAPSEPGDEQAVNLVETVGGEPGTGAVVYRRRTGADVAAGRTLVNLNVASLARRGIIGQGLGAILAQANPAKRILICGNVDTDTRQRRGALLAINAQGAATGDVALISADKSKPFGVTDDINALARYAATTDADVFVAVLGDLARVEAARTRLDTAAYRAARHEALQRLDSFFLQLLAIRHLDTETVDLLLISPCPPSALTEQIPSASSHLTGETWEQLTPILALGPHFPPGLLTSPTTRTPGLVSNTDIAPSMLRALDVPVPPTTTGRPMRIVTVSGGSEAVLPVLSRLDYVTTINARALTLVAMPIGGLCFALVLGAIFAYRFGKTRLLRLLCPGIVFTQSLPLGFLLATIHIPPTLLEYGLRVLACMAALTVCSYILSRLFRLSPPVACGLIGIILIAIDLCCGQQLLKDSLWSGYALSGIRYYGIGNEYLGVILGYALLGGFGEEFEEEKEKRRKGEKEKKNHETHGGAPKEETVGTQLVVSNTQEQTQSKIENRKSKIVILCWLALMVLLGWPMLGANAGSLIVTGAGFGVGAWSLSGKRVTVWTALICLSAGIALSFVFGAIDAWLFGSGASHAGNVLSAANGARGANYLLEIMARKATMNLHLLTTPFFLLGISLVAILGGLMRVWLGKAVQDMLQTHPRLKQSLPALTTTLLAALLFKDSGVVTAGLLTGVTCLYFLWHTLDTEKEKRRKGEKEKRN